MLEILQAFMEIVINVGIYHCGDVHDFEGDGALLYFEGVGEAVPAAFRLRDACTARPGPSGDRVRSRYPNPAAALDHPTATHRAASAIPDGGFHRVEVVRRHDRNHADAHIEHPVHLFRWGSTLLRQESELRRRHPALHIHDGVDLRRKDPSQVPRDSAARDMGERPDLPLLAGSAQNLQIGSVHPEEHISDRLTEAGPRIRHFHTHALEQHLSDETEAVGVDPARLEPQQRISGTDIARSDLPERHPSKNETGQIVMNKKHHKCRGGRDGNRQNNRAAQSLEEERIDHLENEIVEAVPQNWRL